MSKNTDIIFCVVYSALLYGMGWLFMKASELQPKTLEVATLAPARPVKTVIFRIPQEEAIDRTIICGGGDEVYKPHSLTTLAEKKLSRC